MFLALKTAVNAHGAMQCKLVMKGSVHMQRHSYTMWAWGTTRAVVCSETCTWVVENSELGIPHQHTGQREWGCRRCWLVCLTSNVCIVFTIVWTQQRGNAAQERVNQGLKMSELCLPCWACQGFLPGWFLMGRLSLGLCGSLEPDMPPAAVRLNLATAGNHVALLGSLGLGFFFLGGK